MCLTYGEWRVIWTGTELCWVVLCLARAKKKHMKATTAQLMHGKSLTFSGHERAFFTGKSHLQKVGEFQEGKHRAWYDKQLQSGRISEKCAWDVKIHLGTWRNPFKSCWKRTGESPSGSGTSQTRPMQFCQYLGHIAVSKNLLSPVLLKGRAQLSPSLRASSGEVMRKSWKLSMKGCLLLKFLLVKFREELRSAFSMHLAKVWFCLCSKSMFFIHSGISELLSWRLMWKVTEKNSIHVTGLRKGSSGPAILWEFVLPLGNI